MNTQTARWRLAMATLALFASAGWYWRPVDRSVLLPVPFANGKMGYVNYEGRTAFQDRWRMAGEFNHRGIAEVLRDSSLECIDRTGQVVTHPPMGEVSQFQRHAELLLASRNFGRGIEFPEVQEEPQLVTKREV